MIGTIFLHLAVNGQHQLVRGWTLATLEASATLFPGIVNRAVIHALSAFLSHDRALLSMSSAEDASASNRTADRLAMFCLASFPHRGSCEERASKSSLVNFIVLAHHPAIGTFMISQFMCDPPLSALLGGKSRQLWVELCQKARIDPHSLVEERADDMLRDVFSIDESQSKVMLITWLYRPV